MNAKSKKAPNPLENYEQQVEALESIINALEQGELSLDQALSAYEQGINLIRQCQQALDSAEQKVRLLSQNHSGEEQLQNYMPKASSPAASHRNDDDDMPF